MAEYAYKMFNEDLTCTKGKGTFQYVPGVWFEEPEANCVRNGFHSAKNPLDCLTYYHSFSGCQCWIVDIDGDIDEDDVDSKVSSTKIKLRKKLTLAEFVAEAVKYIIKHPSQPLNRLVHGGSAETNADGWAISCGPNAAAAGRKIGDVIGIIETGELGEITRAGVFEINGKNHFPGIFYDASGVEVKK